MKLLFALLLLNLDVHSQPHPNILIVYHSVEGHTQQMAEAVARGARSLQVLNVRLRTVSEATNDDVLWADAIIVGTPVYNANVAPPVQEFINRWPFENAPLRNKIGAAFVTGGGISAGEEATQLSLIRSMLIFGMIVVGGPDWTTPFGASAVTAEHPFGKSIGGKDTKTVADQFLKKGEALGRRVAELAIQLHDR